MMNTNMEFILYTYFTYAAPAAAAIKKKPKKKQRAKCQRYLVDLMKRNKNPGIVLVFNTTKTRQTQTNKKITRRGYREGLADS